MFDYNNKINVTNNGIYLRPCFTSGIFFLFYLKLEIENVLEF